MEVEYYKISRWKNVHVKFTRSRMQSNRCNFIFFACIENFHPFNLSVYAINTDELCGRFALADLIYCFCFDGSFRAVIFDRLIFLYGISNLSILYR